MDKSLNVYKYGFGEESEIYKKALELFNLGWKFSDKFCTLLADSPKGKQYKLQLPVTINNLVKKGIVNYTVILEWLNLLEAMTEKETVTMENNNYHLMLEHYNPNVKLKLITYIREFSGESLKSIVDKVNLAATVPTIVYTDVSTKVQTLANHLISIGCKVKIMEGDSTASQDSLLSKNPTGELPKVEESDLDFPEEKLSPFIKPSKDKNPMPSIVKLKDASFIGQDTKGSSSDSVYKCIAISKDLKISARLKDQVLSIRAEWPNECKHESALIGTGINMNNGYASLHLKLNGCPVERAIGAFLYSLGDIFDEIATKDKVKF